MTKIVIVGEAWGREEEEQGRPFVGGSGRLLYSMLKQAGIDRQECFMTNVFNQRPKPTNDVKNMCGTKAEGIPGLPALQRSKYVLAEHAHELERLESELHAHAPNLILALGATPTWALLQTSGIKNIRGAPVMCDLGYKVLPTYHPAAVMRQWKLRPIVIADLNKARKESMFKEVSRPNRQIWIEPTLQDLEVFEHQFIHPSNELSIDIETKEDQITCIGFAPNKDVALVVPFVAMGYKEQSYWPSLFQELKAWDWVRRMCRLRKARFVGQNFKYDMNFLWTKYGIPTPGLTDDTMLLHHALQPEMEKSLGFLGSIYTNEAVWKFMRKTSTFKQED